MMRPVSLDKIFGFRSGLLLICLLVVALLSGCATTVKYGKPVNIERLRDLKQGVSTRAEVVVAAGEPRGRGAARLSPAIDRRDIMFYEYVESDGTRVRMKLLLVFLDGERYDGHLWFSSTGLLQTVE
jgi:hypothetical protein